MFGLHDPVWLAKKKCPPFCEGSALPGADQVLQLLESETVVRASGENALQRIPRRVRYVLERMSLANLTMSGRFPKLIVNELKDLRETARILQA